ncbi:MAG: hypothetical protein JXB49_35030 [Bacteroidales bacterium]|nr:hypothetical protein [Bacteroidales bacterium]
MSKIFHKSFRVILVALLMVVFTPPLNNALAQEELPNDEFVSTTGETTPVDEDTAQDTGESDLAEDESVQDTGESDLAEDESLQETGEADPAEEDSVQETGEADPAEEDPVQAPGEPPATEEELSPAEEDAIQAQESTQAAENNESAEEELPPEEEADQAANEAAPLSEETILLSEEIIDVVRQMADVNAMLLDEQNQPISLASEEAVELLKQNAAQISNAILSSSSSSDPTVIISQENANVVQNADDGIGQSFTSTANGSLTMIEFAPNFNSIGTVRLRIYLGSPGSGTVLHSQQIAITDTVNSTGVFVDSFTFQSVTIDTPVALSQGQSYSFTIDDSFVFPDFAVNGMGTYSGGSMYNNDGASWDINSRDMAFRVYITMNQTVTSNNNLTNNLHKNIEIEKEEKSLRAQFIHGPDDYGLVPAELRIQGILSYTFDDGYIVFNLPDNVPSEDVTILFWNGSSWSYLPCILVIDNQIQGPAVGSGTYIMVVNK